jgi:hypothetical protein
MRLSATDDKSGVVAQGTPISIGGGVLAFTILGVHYNPETNIADTHRPRVLP